MIDPAARVWNEAERGGFEFSVLENRKADAPHVQVGIVDADTAVDRCRIERVGQVARLGPLHLPDVGRGLEIATILSAFAVRFFSAGTPEVGLPHIVVVGNRHRRPVPGQRAKVATEFEPVGEVVVVVIDLIAGKKEQIGIDLFHVFHQICSRNIAPSIGIDRVARKGSDDNVFLFHRIFTDRASVKRFAAVDHAKRNDSRSVPRRNAERGRKTWLLDLCAGNLAPTATILDLEPHLAVGAGRQGVKLSG